MTVPEVLTVGSPVEGDPARVPGAIRLRGSHVRLEPVDPEGHAPQLFAGSHGDPVTESLWTYMPYGPFDDVAEMRRWLRSIAHSSDPVFAAVLEARDGSPIGMVSLLNHDAAMRRIELGHIWYAPAAQRGRANTEAAYLLLDHVFGSLGYRRAEWKCDALNARSRAAALRLGFTFEGVFRAHMIVKGRNRDTAWFSIVDSEWPARRAAIERWLAAPPGELSLSELTAQLPRYRPGSIGTGPSADR